MRMFGKLALAVGLTALLSTPAWAQGRGGFGGPGAGGAMLLVNKGVQEELKVTEDQASKLESLSQATRDKMREAMQDVPQEERFRKMAEIGPKIQADVDKGLAEILKPEQVKRFHQIQIQASSYNAFSMPKVVEKLKLTDAQKDKIKEISEEARTASREIFQSAQGDREAAMTKMQELNKTTFAKVSALLTDTQKSDWKDLIGAPYEVKFAPRPQ